MNPTLAKTDVAGVLEALVGHDFRIVETSEGENYERSYFDTTSDEVLANMEYVRNSKGGHRVTQCFRNIG